MSSDEANWRKSTRSSSTGGDCVEVARLSDDTVGIRDSKNPAGGHLTVGRAEAAGLLSRIKTGATAR